jgi:hypothetical protein
VLDGVLGVASDTPNSAELTRLAAADGRRSDSLIAQERQLSIR